MADSNYRNFFFLNAKSRFILIPISLLIMEAYLLVPRYKEAVNNKTARIGCDRGGESALG